MTTIDLNCDMGESFGAYKLGRDEDVIKFISSANIACGWHAGDAMVMNRSVQLAAANGVGVGAHPELPGPHGIRAAQHGLHCGGNSQLRDVSDRGTVGLLCCERSQDAAR